MILPQILAQKPAFSALQTGLSSVRAAAAGAALRALPRKYGSLILSINHRSFNNHKK